MVVGGRGGVDVCLGMLRLRVLRLLGVRLLPQVEAEVGEVAALHAADACQIRKAAGTRGEKGRGEE